MRLTIIPSDGTVICNGISKIKLDLTQAEIPLNIHAFQWYNNFGEIEYVNNLNNKPQNEKVENLPEWANNCIDIFNS